MFEQVFHHPITEITIFTGSYDVYGWQPATIIAVNKDNPITQISMKQLDPALLAPTRSFKAQAFPAALISMGAVLVTAMLGAAKDNYGVSITYHHFAAIGCVAINLLAAAVEFNAIRRNGFLIDEVLSAAGRSIAQ